MRNIILASVAAFALTIGYANAHGPKSQHEPRAGNAGVSIDGINLWAGETEDGERDRRYLFGSSTSTFSGRADRLSTHSGRRGYGIIRDHDENDRSQHINTWAGEKERRY